METYTVSCTTNILLQLLSVLVVISICKKLARLTSWRTNLNDVGRPIPGPWRLPLVGNLHQLSQRPFVEFTAMQKTFGNIFQVKLGSWNTVVLSGNDVIKEAFNKNGTSFAGRAPFPSFSYVINGHSFTFNSYSEKWRRKKKILVKALDVLTKGQSGLLETHISDSAVALCNDLTNSGINPIDPMKLLKWHQTNLMITLVYGPPRDTEQRHNEITTIANAFEQFLYAVSRFAVFDILPGLLKIFKTAGVKLQDMSTQINDTLVGIMQKHSTAKCAMSPGYALDTIKMIAEEIKGTSVHESVEETRLSYEECLDLTQDIVGAGLDTVSNTLSWIIMYLAKYPDMQSQVRSEIEENIGFNRCVKIDDMVNMPYTTSCIYEICRHAAVMPLTIPHFTLNESNICGFTIPKGTIIIGNLYALCHDAEVWEDPNVFKPDRFLTETNNIDFNRINMMCMYGTGKRMCIGQTIAKLELFMFFTTITQKCVVSEHPDHPLPMGKGLFEVSHRPLPYQVCVQPFIK